MKLKMCTQSKTFGNISLKSVRDFFFFFFQYLVGNQGKDRVRHEKSGEDSIFRGAVTFNRRVRFKILGMNGENSPQSLT